MIPSSVADSATYAAYAAGWHAVRRMPEGAAYRMFDTIADRQWKARSAGVRRLEANLSRVLGPLPEIEARSVSHTGMRSYMRYWCDAFRLPGWDKARINTFSAHELNRFEDALERGRGVVLALPHMGNWDHAGAFISLNFAPVHSVAEKLRPAKLFDAFVSYRESLGMRIHGLGEPGVYQRLVDACRAGGVVALLADRDLSARGVRVTFFGEATRFPAGPAALAVDTGAVLLPVSLYWTGVNSADVLAPVVPPEHGDRAERIRAATQDLATAFEAGIREHPTDWHMLQRLWLADLDQARLAERDAQDRET